MSIDESNNDDNTLAESLADHAKILAISNIMPVAIEARAARLIWTEAG
jgi:hypothetical protein